MKLLPENEPFVLCEDARPGAGGARLFRAPQEIIVANSLEEIAPALARVRQALRGGRYCAGWLSYEAGFAFEPRLMAGARAAEAPTPLLWFGVFESFLRLTREELANALPDPAGVWISPPRPRMSRPAYEAAFARAKRYIAAGDIYQVNLSYRADVTLEGHPLAAYARLRDAGRGGWSGVVFSGSAWLISTSPELFFKLSGGAIEARPMKGTARRGADAASDRRAALALRDDPKERAENVMIVDLLRNDISRIAARGSVHAPEMFSVETYPTVHAMTSTVRARLREDCDAVDMLGALFPCGSVTGAPKIRAMQIIGELETDARGAYTGSIGWMAPQTAREGGDAEFNVAIRTLSIAGGKAELGLGSAVVFDSNAEGEWEECRAKGAFLTVGAPRFDLIETMRFDPGEGVRNFGLHMARLRASAGVFGFPFDDGDIRARVEAATAPERAPRLVRLLLAPNGGVTLELKPAPAFSGGAARAALAPCPVAPDDFRLRHKTTSREFYDTARAAGGRDEAVFVDAEGFVTEGSFTNVFLWRDGVWLTPPAGRGLLPGVLRAALLRAGAAVERDIRPADLAGGFHLGNSVRGLVPASLCGPA